MKTLLFALCLFISASFAQDQSVDSILARMDQASPNFHAMSADVRMLTYTAILSDKTVEDGTLKMQRLKAGDVRAIIDFSGQTDARVIAFLGKIVRIYYPKVKAYQDYEVGKNSDVLNQFLLLGFGSSGKDLAQSYTISMEGQEKVAGEDTAKLLLLPKDSKVQQRLTKIEIWIPARLPYPVQQQFYEPSGNYRTVTYSNIQLNPPIHGTLDLKLPPGAKRQSQ
ncbi:MAG: outer membrane lipoprotein-sorting protein [Acidobacteriaceae bacterium]|nr:outer membrane lipoprotein-sorting protein [Acidobacteriaceae bacterium]MBV9294481.1 outer membrane lipoprotein-sorting protein [Acidobacteriaceae bacterium]MBV9763584.1 outer membrane lipoprotein-sorting protein [Acidobacteriaceae bacterium]